MQYNVLFSEYYLYGLCLFSCNSRNTQSRRRLPREQRQQQQNQYIFIQFILCALNLNLFHLVWPHVSARKHCRVLANRTFWHTHTRISLVGVGNMEWIDLVADAWTRHTLTINHEKESAGFLALWATVLLWRIPHSWHASRIPTKCQRHTIHGRSKCPAKATIDYFLCSRAHIAIWTVMNRKNEMKIQFCAANCERKASDNESTATTHETRA